MADTEDVAIDPLIGQYLGGFEIIALAGEGGMGRVYRAWDGALRRPVALKVLRPERTESPMARRRLLREARAASAVDHPGIATVYAVGCEQDLDFIALEWVDGRSLADVLDHGALPCAQALEIGLALAEALGAVHSSGLLHRDLKPSNVMLTKGSGVKVLDFGIARFSAVDDTTLSGTDSGLADEARPGTPAYMSPEQVLGAPLDRRSDLFALGILLYEMTTGRRPFQGANPADLARQLVYGQPEPLGRVCSEIPRQLEHVVQRALEKKPEDRFPTAEALAEALRHCPTEVVGASSSKHRARRRWMRISAAGLGLLAIGGAGLVGLGGSAEQNTDTATTIAVPELPRTPFELYVSGTQRLERYDRGGYIDEAIGFFEQAIEKSDEYAPAWEGLAWAFWRQYRVRRDPEWLEKAVEAAERACELDPQLVGAGVVRARIRAMEGDLETARGKLEHWQELDPGNAEILAGLAEVAFLERDHPTAIRLQEQAFAAAPKNWQHAAELGRYQLADGRLEAAEAAFRLSLGLVSDNVFARRNLGAVLHFQGRYAEAVAELQLSITIRPTAAAYANLGTAYFFQGRYQEAAASFEQSLELGANYYLLWSNLGDAYRQIPGRSDDARRSLERARQLLGQRLAGRPGDPVLRSRLALNQAKSGEVDAALGTLAGIAPLTDQPSDVAYRAALIYELSGRREAALDALETALEGGYPAIEAKLEPDLVSLRESLAYHELMLRFEQEPQS